VRVRAGAFGSGAPHRDLLLSPDHAVQIDGVLIPVRYLINGATVAQQPAGRITYWHVELERHDILRAEGLPCESYLDTGNRGAFENGGGARHLHPDFALRVWATEACARLVVGGAELEAARSWLLARAEALGFTVTAEPALRLVVDGCTLAPRTDAGVHRFRLPPGAGAAHLVSRSAVPAHLAAAGDDHRVLGVAVSRIVLDGRPMSLTHARLETGWHDVEGANPAWRWTDGCANIPLRGASVLEIEIALSPRYWREFAQETVRAG
jgi:hypothetical protein